MANPSPNSDHLRHKTSRELLEFYTRLVGFAEAVKLLAKREQAANKLAKKAAKNRTERLATSNARLNAPNLASNSLVGRNGGKRKPKKSKRGY